MSQAVSASPGSRLLVCGLASNEHSFYLTARSVSCVYFKREAFWCQSSEVAPLSLGLA